MQTPDLRFQILAFRFQISDFSFRFQISGLDFRFQIPDSRFRMHATINDSRLRSRLQTRGAQNYTLKAVRSRLMPGCTALDMNIELSAGSTALLDHYVHSTLGYNVGFLISDFRDYISDFRLQISDFIFQIAAFRFQFQISDFRFHIADFIF